MRWSAGTIERRARGVALGMKVLLVHHATVPVFAYGGTERVVWDLAKALVTLGHEVGLLVPPGSRCGFAPVFPYEATCPLESQIPRGFDVVHLHFHPESEVDLPHLVTEHGNTKEPRPFPRNTVFVSRDHARRYGAEAYVYNGLDWSAYGPVDLRAGRHRHHFLGKGSAPVKNLQGAIDTALRAKLELDVLGARRFNVSRRFRWTWSRSIHFHGMVGGGRKNRLLQHSRGLLFPVRWHEPFGLAVIESLYFGAPVFATPYGALPELVSPEVGVLACSSEVLAHAMHLDTFDPRACHERVVRHFDHVQMARCYLLHYERVCAGEALNAAEPVLPGNGRALLEWS